MFKDKWILLFFQCQRARYSQVKHSTEQGLSLLECVMALAVIALTGAMMLPPLFVASATRVQNRRAEQALQITQGEIDRVRGLVEQQQQSIDSYLPKKLILTGDDTIADVAAPTTVAQNKMRSPFATCEQNSELPIEVGEVILIDLDGDAACDAEFVMQVFRVGANNDDFQLAARTYSASVLNDAQSAIQGTLSAEEASLKYTTGTGNQTLYPLAVLYTNIKAVNSGRGMCKFQKHESC